MFCYPLPPLETDIPYWVSEASFYQHFDQQDFTCRDILDVVDAYLEGWFDFDEAGNRQFMIPPVSVKNGVTQFISGRHRTAVLLKFMQRIPICFDSRWLAESDKKWVDSVAAKKIDVSKLIELPDLPIRKVLP